MTALAPVLKLSGRQLYTVGTMTDVRPVKDKEDQVAIPPWAIAILVSIALAGIGNIMAMSSWKGALDSKLANIEVQLTRIDNIPNRVSVAETRMEADRQEWRSRIEDISRRVIGIEEQFRSAVSRAAPVPAPERMR